MDINCFFCGEFIGGVSVELAGAVVEDKGTEEYICNDCFEDEHPEWNMHIRLLANSMGQ